MSRAEVVKVQQMAAVPTFEQVQATRQEAVEVLSTLCDQLAQFEQKNPGVLSLMQSRAQMALQALSQRY